MWVADSEGEEGGFMPLSICVYIIIYIYTFTISIYDEGSIWVLGENGAYALRLGQGRRLLKGRGRGRFISPLPAWKKELLRI